MRSGLKTQMLPDARSAPRKARRTFFSIRVRSAFAPKLGRRMPAPSIQSTRCPCLASSRAIWCLLVGLSLPADQELAMKTKSITPRLAAGYRHLHNTDLPRHSTRSIVPSMMNPALISPRLEGSLSGLVSTTATEAEHLGGLDMYWSNKE